MAEKPKSSSSSSAEDEGVLNLWYSPSRTPLDQLMLPTCLWSPGQQASEDTIVWNILTGTDCRQSCHTLREITFAGAGGFKRKILSLHGSPGNIDHAVYISDGPTDQSRYVANLTSTRSQSISSFLEDYQRRCRVEGMLLTGDSNASVYQALGTPLQGDNGAGVGTSEPRDQSRDSEDRRRSPTPPRDQNRESGVGRRLLSPPRDQSRQSGVGRRLDMGEPSSSRNPQ